MSIQPTPKQLDLVIVFRFFDVYDYSIIPLPFSRSISSRSPFLDLVRRYPRGHGLRETKGKAIIEGRRIIDEIREV